MSIYNEYYTAQAELEEKYGVRSIVLMQVGSFYEIYGVDVPSIQIGHAEQISKILSMQLAQKDGTKPHTKKNPQMVGFPDRAFGKHISTLLKHNFTVAVYNQFDVPNSKPKDPKIRKLVNVYTPSTFIDEDVCESNALMIIGTGDYKDPITKKIIDYARCAILVLTTGSVTLTDIYNTHDDNKKVDTELYRLIHTFNPSEILFSGKIKDIEKRYDLVGKKVYYKEIIPTYTQASYQNQFLDKVYGSRKDLVATAQTPLEYLGLARDSEVVPYFIQGLQYAYEHDPLIISKIKIPELLVNHDHLILNNDSIYQLHLIEQGGSTEDYGGSKFTSIFNTVNQTKTAMGKRLLKKRLLMPSTDIDELELRYKLINTIMEENDATISYGELLREITDIDRNYRKMVVNRLQPYELANMKNTFIAINKVLIKGKDVFSIDSKLIKSFKQFYTNYIKTFNHEYLKEGKLGSAKRSYFNPGICPEIDEIEESITSNSSLLTEIANQLSDIIDKKKKGSIRIEYNLQNGYFLRTTTIRFNKIPKDTSLTLSNGDVVKYSDFKLTKLKNAVKFTSPLISKVSKIMIKKQYILSSIITKEYLTVLDKWSSKYGKTINEVSLIIAEIDFINNAAKIAAEYGYCEPIISDDHNGRSYLVATDLRHPILERIITTAEYVSNDIEIGTGKHLGTILYGVNMSGKSSLLRSVGVAVVMAQAGMFIAADEFTYYPFTQIMSKITVQDNPFKGQSLFMVEMEEVNNMLRRGDNRTLVLSDELCSSTETSSAHSIVACTLSYLVKRDINFIFSTHLHELQNIPDIIDNPAIEIMHFKVSIENQQMIFDRNLQSGGIADTYGLEIAQALGLPSDFIKDAFRIRNFLRNDNTQNEILSTKKSRYSKDVFMHQCTSCGTTKALETHHIYYQCTANKNGLIKKKTKNSSPMHKHNPMNLRVLCRHCHQQVHKHEENLGIKKLAIPINI